MLVFEHLLKHDGNVLCSERCADSQINGASARIFQMESVIINSFSGESVLICSACTNGPG